MNFEMHSQIDAHTIAFLWNPVMTPCHKLGPVVGSSLCPAVPPGLQILVLFFSFLSCHMLLPQHSSYYFAQAIRPCLPSPRLVLSGPHTLPPNLTPNDHLISWCHPSAISPLGHTLFSTCLSPSIPCIASCMFLLPLVSSAVNNVSFPWDSWMHTRACHLGNINRYLL